MRETGRVGKLGTCERHRFTNNLLNIRLEQARHLIIGGVANPKSSSLAPDFVSMMLPGFKSR